MLFTTSRKPSKNTRIFSKKISNLLPDSIYLTRGKKGIEELVEIARSKGYPKICIVTDKQGNPHLMRFITLNNENWNWAEELKIKGVYLTKEKQKWNSINCPEELEKLFNTSSDEEAENKILKQDNQIIFKNKEKVIVKIKLQE